MRILKQEELGMVDPEFRELVIDAWAKGEDVPYGVRHLISSKPNDDDIRWAMKWMAAHQRKAK